MAKPTEGATGAVMPGNETILHESGLLFYDAVERNFGSLQGKTPWGQLLNNPQFVDLEGFGAAIDLLDAVRSERIRSYDGPVIEGYQAIVSKRTGIPYSVVSDRYEAVQDVDVALPFFSAAQGGGLKTIGRMDTGNGQTRGHVVMANPEFTIRLLEEYAEDVMLGVKWWNSYRGDLSFGAEIFGVRTVCVNYCLWGHLLGRLKHSHVGDVGEMVANYEELLKGAIEKSSVLTDLASRAFDIEVERETVPDLLWGIKLTPTAIKIIDADLNSFAPEIGEMGLNAWTLYNAVTAYISYRPRGGQNLTSTDYYTRQANELLEASHVVLIYEGQARKEAFEEARKKRLELLNAKRVAATAAPTPAVKA